MSNLADLHELIHSLSIAEKRNFKRSSSAYQGSQVLDLFDLLNNQVQFSPDGLQDLIKEMGLLANLPTLMARLRRLLINSLRSLNSHTTSESRLLYLLEEVQFLYKRNLSIQALKKIKKARKLALEFSRIPIALQLNYYHRQILLNLHQQGKNYDEIQEEEKRLLELASLQFSLDNLHIRARAWARSGLEGDKKMGTPFYSGLDIEAGLRSEDFLCQVYANYSVGVSRFALQEYSVAHAAFETIMKCWRAHPRWINEKPRLFLSSFSNYQTCLMVTQEDGFEEIDSLHALFASHRFQEADVRIQFERGSYQTRLLLHLNKGRFEEGTTLSLEILDWLEKRSGQLAISAELAFRYNLFSFFFLQEKFSEANRMIRAIQQVAGTEERKDIREFIRILEPLVQYEIGNVDLVDNLIRNMKRYFMKRHDLAPAIPIMLEFFRQGDLGNKKDLGRLLLQLQERMARNTRNYTGERELLLWVEARVKGESVTKLFLSLLGTNSTSR